ncbi:Rne/Rng family ribonuclease [uncultured Selenomonas sp.]|uniref:Rne/Rng family ribonuclease n=1 Tax=uncultured Selenomonas sp. TaxID=159275 RepID=UPI0025FDC1DD|nr:Rne/Rng family ribonuclease [uncultured Selenomonas sp.]
MKSILLNIVPEETRMAIVEDGELLAVEVERASHAHLVGNIYKGRVQNVLPGMQAAFVDIGQEKNAFLYIGDGAPHDVPKALAKNSKHEKFHVGQNVMVEIIKDATGTKGPRATTHLSIPGRNLVLMPTAAYTGLSRQIEDEAERSRLHALAERYAPEGMGLIVRTAAEGLSEDAFASDATYLANLWASIARKFQHTHAPALLYRDADLLVRIVRDRFSEDIDEFIIDDKAACERVRELVGFLSPTLVERVKFYDGRTPLFQQYGIEQEIEHVGARVVELKSGGFLVIDKTEALTVIDVNTGKYVGKTNLGDTVYQLNLEAATEILKQLRLRDIGGIIIVDFIDMDTAEQKAELLSVLRDGAKNDRAKTNVIDITALGLVEITRKKSRSNFESVVYSECPTCHGRGRIESPETVSIRISRDIRRMEHKNHAKNGYEIAVHETVAEELRQNQLMMNLAAEFGTDIKVIVQPGIHPETYTILQQV